MPTEKTKPGECQNAEHQISRRLFMNSLAVSMAGAGGLIGNAGSAHLFDQEQLNHQLKARGRSVILVWLAGGASQFETWDPKPGRATGGPFGTIPTTIPGLHVSELMPMMAKRMHQTCLIRSLNTKDSGHDTASVLMMRGRKDEPAMKYPDIGAILAKELARADSEVPDYVSFYSQTEGRHFSKLTPSFLGARFAPMQLTDQMTPPNLKRLGHLSDIDHHARAELQALLSRQFAHSRDSELVKSHASAYARVQGLMSSEKLFDIDREPVSIRERYGPTLFGKQMLLARRLAESGVPFVRVGRAWWDSHGQNFETHQEMVPELDRVLSALLDDLRQRGMLDHTLVVVMGEFGRTPEINAQLGRDHFSRAWSALMAGCGIQEGAIFGETDKDGKEVKEGEVGAGELFATMLHAVGIPHDKNYYFGPRPVPLVNYGIEPIRQVLS
ncbi:MAG: DUF1501 domain-containing protein [Verrucomicrobia bacterium]|jgi:hypothetical protein|nr:DUF1501 domain-containing protein [Verrucomicrobiota bacterium]